MALEEVEDDPRISRCGLWSWRPRFLNVFNKPMVYLLLYSFTSFCVILTLGMNQVLIPTLQQLFNLSSKEIGLILISNDLSGLIVAFAFGHFSSKGKVRWLFFGVCLCLLANIIQSGTQLFVELPEHVNVTRNGTTVKDGMLCSPDLPSDGGVSAGGTLGVTEGVFYAVKNNKLFWALFVAGLLQGVGGIPQQVCGMTYLDEVMTEKKLGPAIAFSNIVQYSGFSLSFIFGGLLLTQYVTLGPAPEGVTLGHSHWVGAWWMGYFVPGVFLLLSGLPLILFPTQMPAAKKVLQDKIDRGEVTGEEKDTELNRSYIALLKDMLPTLKRLMTNKALVMLLIGEASSNIFLSSMPYEPKLLSLLFKISISDVGQLTGLMKFLGCILGLLVGGLVMGKYNLTGKQCMLYVALVQLTTIPVGLLSIYHCNTDQVAGISLPYPSDVESQWIAKNLTTSCNSICDCSTKFYDPVCDLSSGVTYFSACHAGCSSPLFTNDITGLSSYEGCVCARGASLTPGPCPTEDSCSTKRWIVFIIQSFLGVLLYISAYPSLHVAYLRVVPEMDRSATQGLKQFFTRAFGFLLGPMIFGALIDLYCDVWRDSDGTGSCWIYSLHEMIVTYTFGQVGFRVVAIICYFLSWKFYPDKTSYTELAKTEIELKPQDI